MLSEDEITFKNISNCKTNTVLKPRQSAIANCNNAANLSPDKLVLDKDFTVSLQVKVQQK